MKKKITRTIALLVVLASIFTLVSTVAFAASSKSGTNIIATVETGKRPWYSILSPTVTVKNTGSSGMTIVIYDSYGRQYSTLTCLKAGKSHTFSLKQNQTYSIGFCGNTLSGGSWKATGTITAGRYITDIR